MLEPEDRRLLLESLRPPEGYALDHAVGTTFSLDLLALLTAPLAFTFFDWEGHDGENCADPLALLESVRRHAGRITIFCQSGRISVPVKQKGLYAYLESSVCQVIAPKENGVFHPKVWLLRFVADGRPVRYRLLCLSRNLTFDRSWDTALVLDGDVVDRKVAYSVNHPLGEFIEALPGMALQPLSGERSATVNLMAEEVRKVAFELPDGFDEYAFWPLGIRARAVWPFGDSHRPRILAVSPFLADDLLGDLVDGRQECFLVTRPEAAAELRDETLEWFDDIYVLSPSATPEPVDAMEGEDEKQPADTDRPLDGLHAKLFVIDDGWNARLWTGSANATNAAFSKNVEFLVELVGKKSFCGIDKILEKAQGATTFRSLLTRYERDEERIEEDGTQKELDDLLNTARNALARTVFTAEIGAHTDEQTCPVALTWPSAPELPAGVTVHCRPITLEAIRAVPFPSGNDTRVDLGELSVERLTAFFVFSLHAELREHEQEAHFVLKVDLKGAPGHRLDMLLRSLLKNRAQVMRLLLLLLADEGLSVNDLPDLEEQDPTTGKGGTWSGEVALFESLLRALDRDPAKLERVNDLVADLASSEQTRELLPEGFEKIWQPIWESAQGRTNG